MSSQAHKCPRPIPQSEHCPSLRAIATAAKRMRDPKSSEGGANDNHKKKMKAREEDRASSSTEDSGDYVTEAMRHILEREAGTSRQQLQEKSLVGNYCLQSLVAAIRRHPRLSSEYKMAASHLRRLICDGDDNYLLQLAERLTDKQDLLCRHTTFKSLHLIFKVSLELGDEGVEQPDPNIAAPYRNQKIGVEKVRKSQGSSKEGRVATVSVDDVVIQRCLGVLSYMIKQRPLDDSESTQSPSTSAPRFDSNSNGAIFPHYLAPLLLSLWPGAKIPAATGASSDSDDDSDDDRRRTQARLVSRRRRETVRAAKVIEWLQRNFAKILVTMPLPGDLSDIKKRQQQNIEDRGNGIGDDESVFSASLFLSAVEKILDDADERAVQEAAFGNHLSSPSKSETSIAARAVASSSSLLDALRTSILLAFSSTSFEWFYSMIANSSVKTSDPAFDDDGDNKCNHAKDAADSSRQRGGAAAVTVSHNTASGADLCSSSMKVLFACLKKTSYSTRHHRSFLRRLSKALLLTSHRTLRYEDKYGNNSSSSSSSRWVDLRDQALARAQSSFLLLARVMHLCIEARMMYYDEGSTDDGNVPEDNGQGDKSAALVRPSDEGKSEVKREQRMTKESDVCGLIYTKIQEIPADLCPAEEVFRIFVVDDEQLVLMLSTLLQTYLAIEKEEQRIRRKRGGGAIGDTFSPICPLSPSLSPPKALLDLCDRLHPHRLMYRLLQTLGFDVSIFIDWLITGEARFLPYVTRYLKFLAVAPHSAVLTLGHERCAALRLAYEGFEARLRALYVKNVFPYNIAPLLKIMSRASEALQSAAVTADSTKEQSV